MRADPGNPAVKTSSAVLWLSALIVVLASVSAGLGLFWQEGKGPLTFTTLRGHTVQMYGRGLYRHDTLFIGAGNKGVATVVLVLGVPLLILSALLYRRGSLRGALLLLGTLAYFLYVHASMALGTAYNPLFLSYVSLLSASLFAFMLAFASIDRQVMPSHFTPHLPRRGLAFFMFACGLVTLGVWLGPLLVSLLQGQPPKLLDSYTTMVTEALDLAIITPATFLSGGLLLRRAPLGYLMACSLLGVLVLLGPGVAVGTVNQVLAGVPFTPREIVGPISGFSALSLAALGFLAAILRHVSDGGAGPR
ncbi:hypothetical protein [Archangium violaceum]|uniref:hypothetical protein n=1 Tax=Archangium violaceum TaxID=83451 RepID=UPI000698E09B|nr:hypothetical protein [Archangium violaceum]